MAVNIALKWRTKLPQQIEHLPFPGLSMAFDEANTVLQARSEVEVVAIVLALWQKLLEHHPTPLPASIIPRLIYALHSNTFSQKVPSEATLNEHLAAAILVELSRACGICAKKMNQASWLEAATAVANARTLSDWIYILEVSDSGIAATEKPLSKQDIDAHVKAKTKKAKSKALTTKSLTKKVLSYYKNHKSDFKSLAHAAGVIHSKDLVPVASSTIYTWLKKYTKGHTL